MPHRAMTSVLRPRAIAAQIEEVLAQLFFAEQFRGLAAVLGELRHGADVRLLRLRRQAA